ncbi:hypothetical protein BP00DRAFT_451764 [Aspergillus indologenus CBS 114.80]|uniref:Uncharacterized protein n=1 Tax=Aspergillus indologenus CBS 114.80 TaxID=1450541 RepID=A0A2V5HPS0_9EURO|nr:hypothetical protein BP00DRAFT_451764 [Aspergillus indologenus CBS 114.80]
MTFNSPNCPQLTARSPQPAAQARQSADRPQPAARSPQPKQGSQLTARSPQPQPAARAQARHPQPQPAARAQARQSADRRQPGSSGTPPFEPPAARSPQPKQGSQLTPAARSRSPQPAPKQGSQLTAGSLDPQAPHPSSRRAKRGYKASYL